MKISILFSVIFGLLPFIGMAQLTPEIDVLFNDKTKMSAKSVVGEWRTNDSIPRKIKITEYPHEVVLTLDENRSFSFHKDTNNRIGVRGIQMHWPPMYCHILWVNGLQLELSFYSMSSQRIYQNRTIFRASYAE